MAIRLGFVFAVGVVLAAGIGSGIAAGAAPARDGGLVAAHAHRPALHARGAHARGAQARGAHGRARLRVAARVGVLRDPALATIAGLRAIERIHRRESREEALPGYLRGVLSRTGDATVRNYVTFRLARMELRGRDANGALRELERGVDENLQRLR